MVTQARPRPASPLRRGAPSRAPSRTRPLAPGRTSSTRRRAPAPLRRFREVEEITRREAERLAPAAPDGEVAQRREAFLDIVEAEPQRMPGVAQLGAAAHRRRGHGARRATDPDRRVPPLHRTGRERGPAEAHVAALVLRNIVGPGSLDGPDV